MLDELQLRPLTRGMIAEASDVLARAFVNNPLHVAAFGAGQLRRNVRFFRMGLVALKGAKWVATDGSRILGVIHWVHAPDCQFSGLDKFRLTPTMVCGFGLRSSRRLITWVSQWSEHDPPAPHAHLGPIGVAPEAQRRHVGHRLMQKYCDEVDRRGESGYLETDRVENVAFYRRFGFEIVREVPVLGVANFLMSRPQVSSRSV